MKEALENAPISQIELIDADKFIMKFFPMDEKIMVRIGEGLGYSIESSAFEPSGEKADVNAEFWEGLKKHARALGVGLIGFTPVKEEYIFGGYRVHYDNAIVLGMEMDFDSIEDAPGERAGLEAMRIYAELGVVTNEISDYLRERGYRAQACHPLGGPILYPAMGVSANLGEIGRHGLLISPEFGPRQRLSMVATEAAPLPGVEHRNFGIGEYCEKCTICMKACPGNAILTEPIVRENGTITRIDYSKCLPRFNEYVGCAVCIKVCPFNRRGKKR